jgi:hypothetical protein
MVACSLVSLLTDEGEIIEEPVKAAFSGSIDNSDEAALILNDPNEAAEES